MTVISCLTLRYSDFWKRTLILNVHIDIAQIFISCEMLKYYSLKQVTLEPPLRSTKIGNNISLGGVFKTNLWKKLIKLFKWHSKNPKPLNTLHPLSSPLQTKKWKIGWCGDTQESIKNNYVKKNWKKLNNVIRKFLYKAGLFFYKFKDLYIVCISFHIFM